jgi:hypothetical protein
VHGPAAARSDPHGTAPLGLSDRDELGRDIGSIPAQVTGLTGPTNSGVGRRAPVARDDVHGPPSQVADVLQDDQQLTLWADEVTGPSVPEFASGEMRGDVTHVRSSGVTSKDGVGLYSGQKPARRE